MVFIFSFQKPKTSFGGGGGREGRRPVVVSEVSPLTEVAAVVRDEPSGLTSKRGNGGPWTATARLRLAANGFVFLDYSCLLGSVYYDFPQI